MRNVDKLRIYSVLCKCSRIIGEMVSLMEYIFNLEEVAKKYSLGDMLTYRPIAKEVKSEVISLLASLNIGSYFVFDFEGIGLCDTSFADELLIETQFYLIKEKKENIIIYIQNFNQAIKENIEGALLRRESKDGIRIFLLIKENGHYSKIGSKLEKNLENTFSFVCEKKRISAREVAEKFELEINSASNRLKKIYDAGLLLREEVIDNNGRQHIYYLP